MPNPGAFHGSRKEFLLGEKKDFAKGVDTGASGEALGIIQRRYFKRYPINLPHNEEPSAEHLAAVDDDAPDPEIKQPDATKMGPAEYVEAMNGLIQRQKRIKKRKAQIKRWLIYQYMKDHDSDPRDRRASSPYQAYLAKIRGKDQEKPRRKSACNVWRKLHRPEIELKAKEVSARDKIPKGKQAALRDKIAREMFAALPEAQRKEWAITAETDHEEALREWKEGWEKGPSTTPEDRQRAIQGLVRFVQPVLDVIAGTTGWQVSLFAGGPEPALEGRLNIISVHSGTTSGDIKLTFGQAERTAIKGDFIPTMGRYLQKCYTPEECRSRALPEEEGYVPLSEMELEGSTALIHGLPETSTSPPSVAASSSLTPASTHRPSPCLPTAPTVPQTATAVATLGTTPDVAATLVATPAVAMRLPAPPAEASAQVRVPVPGLTTSGIPNAAPMVSADMNSPSDAAPDAPASPATPHAESATNPFPCHYQLPFGSPNSGSTSLPPSRIVSPALSPPPSPIRPLGPLPDHVNSPPPSPMLPTPSALPPALPVANTSPAASILAAVTAVPISPAVPSIAPPVSTLAVSLPPPPVVAISVSPSVAGSMDVEKQVKRQKGRKNIVADEARALDSEAASEGLRPRRSIKKTEKAISIEEEMTKRNARGKKRANEESGDASLAIEVSAKRRRGSSKNKEGRS